MTEPAKPWADLGALLTARLDELGMSQTDLANAVGVKPTSGATSHWCSGNGRPDYDRLPRVAQALSLDSKGAAELYRLAGYPAVVVVVAEPIAEAG